MQLLRNSLGLPYHRGRRRAAPPPRKIELEDIVAAYKSKRGEGLLNTIKTATEPLFAARGVPKEDADKILLDCVDRFDYYSGVKFAQYVASALERKYRMAGVDAEKLEAASYKQNGFLSFEEYRVGHPEVLAVSRVEKTERRQAAETEMELQPVSETETEPEPVNTSDQDESEPETAPEVDPDGETEPETTPEATPEATPEPETETDPEPETEDINALEYSDFMREIVQSWE